MYKLDKNARLVGFSRVSTGFIREIDEAHPQRTAYFLTKMRTIPSCPLSGTLPPEIWQMSELEEIWMDDNSLSGDTVV